ncbi:DNA translocase FtsK [Colwellia psychrerythraea]|uniref:DNA translocase FtsK n=1 Tax=Colwellia psychrerythraea TaxID=28229 RepID=A0A099KRE1_COLPS|nr:DNA translocase FtsK 4TM domain-containing protein [Colwellia psychrerythraea]KGJ92785.1 cell division FtsK/SpoIIIE [Colwellia psychrerythraea]
MSSDLIENSDVSLNTSANNQLTGVQRLLEAGLLFFTVFAMFMMLALFSFDPADPGWAQTGYQTEIRNLGGAVGAYLSDLFLNLFGLIAYSLPFVIAIVGWLLFQRFHELMKLDYLTLGLKLIGFFMFYLGVTSLASMNFDDVFYFSAGGILGDALSKTLLPYFSFVGSTLLFLLFTCAGFVLLTGFSWLKFIDNVGQYAIVGVLWLVSSPKLIQAHFGTRDTSSDEEELGNVKSRLVKSRMLKNKDELKESAEEDSSSKSKSKAKSKPAESLPSGIYAQTTTIELPESLTVEEQVTTSSGYVPKNEPFIDIADLMTEPAVGNIQDHVSEKEITAAFADVEKPNVADDYQFPEPSTFTAVEQNVTANNGQVNLVAVEEDKFAGMPSIDLLDRPDKAKNPINQDELDQVSRLVEAKLLDFGVQAQVVSVYPGPVITRFELDLAPGVKVNKITSLSKDLARALSAISVRVVEVIPGKSVIGLELPNKHREIVYLSEVIGCPAFEESKSPLAMVLGKDIAGDPVVVDLGKMPHLLVAGTTGSGKSVGVNTMIVSLLYKSTPEDVRMIMIDPKMLELSVYEGIPHLLAEVVTDMKDAANALRWCVGEMERRYKVMSAVGVRNLKGYNKKVLDAIAAGEPLIDPTWQPNDGMDQTPPMLEKLPSIVVIVDEFADMMMIVGKKVEELIARIAQKARAAGIHLVLATQRPSVDVITGLIKANIPTRMAFQVSSGLNSRTILDQQGAEQLLGMGDMLYLPPGTGVPTRVHGAFVDDHEVHAVVKDWKSRGEPNYVEEILSGENEQDILLPGEQAEGSEAEEVDALYDEAVNFVTEKRRVSISSVQRQFRIGYNRSARIVEQMELQGVVSTPGNNGAREVLAPPPVRDF